MSAQVPVGVGPPVQLRIPISAAQASGLDLTTVTAVQFLVEILSGSTVTLAVWSGLILSVLPPSAPGGSSMVVGHNFATSDCLVAGTYKVVPQLTVPGGTVPAYARTLLVTDPYETGANPTVIAVPGVAPIQEVRFAIGTGAAQTCVPTIPSGAIVVDAQTDIGTPYSPGTTLQVGIVGTPAKFMRTGDNNPQVAGLYSVEQDTAFGPAGVVLLTVIGAPSAGAGFCIVQYTVPQ